MPKCREHPVFISELRLAGAGWHDGVGCCAGGAQGAPAAGGDLIPLALDGAQRATEELQVTGGVIVQDVVVAQVTKDVQLVHLDGQRVALLLKMLQSVLLDVAPTSHMRTAETGPDRLGRVAVDTVPLLRVEDGVVRGQPLPPHMLAPVHSTRPPAQLAGSPCLRLQPLLCADPAWVC